MSTNQSNKESWRKFLGIKDPSTGLESGRVGGTIGRTAGRSGGAGAGGSLDSDSVPEGVDPPNSPEEIEELKKPLEPGDEPEKFKLFDCETGEEVTIDGIGGGGSQPSYPTGFENCDGQKKPTLDELIQNNVTIYRNTIHYDAPSSPPPSIDYYYASLSSAQSGLPALFSAALSYANSKSQHGCEAKIVPPSVGMLYGAWAQWKGQDGQGSCSDNTGFAAQVYGTSSSNSVEWKQAYLDNWSENEWPAVDKNHLAWNKEKGCFEPLCPELNNQVLDKYKACEPERILCDEDGNKVKVTIDGDEMKVLQSKFNREATIKNGVVQTSKQLTESQTEAEFK